ncbi:MAG: DUF3108 domain-containing protein, partial [Flavobacteriales bacterium]|nr:DUF3108 domain-containing protein [Flavobacteriales bacterium]
MNVEFNIFKRLLVWSLFLALLPKAYSQDAPFEDGEVLTYELVYNWGFIWAEAGYVDFSVSDSTHQGEEYYHFIGEGASYKNWDWFYKVRSKYEAFATKDMESVRFIRFGKEGSNYYNRDYHAKQDTIYAHFIDK